MIDAHDIRLNEGEYCLVEITVSDALHLPDYNAKIQVRKYAGMDIILDFTTEEIAEDETKYPLYIDGQKISWNIPANITTDLGGDYKYQVELYRNTVDPIKSDVYNFIIKPAVAI